MQKLREDHLLRENILGLQELSVSAENTRFTRRDGRKHPCRFFRMLPVVFRGLFGVVFRFSRVVVWLSMLPVLRTFWFLSKNQQRSMSSGPSLTITNLNLRGKLTGYIKIQGETLEKRRSSSEITRNPTGRILRGVSVFFTVQPSKTGILSLEISSWNPKTNFSIIVGLTLKNDVNIWLLSGQVQQSRLGIVIAWF